MGNAFDFKCRICNLPPELREWTERQILQYAHSYSRVSTRLQMARSSFAFQWVRHRKLCLSRKALAEQRNRRSLPSVYRTRTRWPNLEGVCVAHVTDRITVPDGQRLDPHVDPASLPILEFEVIFDDAKPAKGAPDVTLKEKLAAPWNADTQPPAAEQPAPDPELVAVAGPPAADPAPCPHSRVRETPAGRKCDDCSVMLEAPHVPLDSPSRADAFATRESGIRIRFGRFG
jgi:hypothetical protein